MLRPRGLVWFPGQSFLPMLLATLPLHIRSLESRAIHIRSAGEVVRELAESTHQPVEIANSLRRHLILFDRGGSTPEQALAALARSLAASLQLGPKGYGIERTTKDEAALVSKTAADRLKWLTASLDENERFRKERRTGKGLQDSLEREIERADIGSDAGSKLSLLLPAPTFLEKLVRRIGLPKIAALRAGSVTVFEDSKLPSSLPLPQWRDLANDYRDQQRGLDGDRLREAWSRQIEDPRVTNPLSVVADSEPSFDRLRVEVRALPSGVGVQLEAYDGRGRRTLSSYLNASEEGRFVQPAEMLKAEREAKGKIEVALSVESNRAFHFLDGEPVEPWPNWFLAPDRSEPLDALVQEALLQAFELLAAQFDLSSRLWAASQFFCDRTACDRGLERSTKNDSRKISPIFGISLSWVKAVDRGIWTGF